MRIKFLNRVLPSFAKGLAVLVIVLGIVFSCLALASTGFGAEGGVWSAPVNISNNSGMSGKWGPAIAIDGEGNLHVVWEDNTPSNYGIMYATKPIGGGWSTPINISNNPGWSYAPDIAIDSNEGIHVVWGGGGILYATKPVGGSWTVPVNTSNSGVWPSIAIDKEDTIHVVWQDYILKIGEDILYGNKTIGGLWSTPIDISNQPDTWEERPQIEVDTGDGLHVVWNGFYATRPYGGSWSTPVSIEPDRMWGVGTAIDNEDTLHVVWHNDYGDLLYAAKSMGDVWSTPENISNTWDYSENPAIAIKSNDSLHLVWADRRFPGSPEILYIAEPNGWSTPANISNNAETSF